MRNLLKSVFGRGKATPRNLSGIQVHVSHLRHLPDTYFVEFHRRDAVETAYVKLSAGELRHLRTEITDVLDRGRWEAPRAN